MVGVVKAPGVWPVSLVADLVGDSALVPVAQLRTRRTRRAVTDEAGAVLVLVEEDAVRLLRQLAPATDEPGAR